MAHLVRSAGDYTPESRDQGQGEAAGLCTTRKARRAASPVAEIGIQPTQLSYLGHEPRLSSGPPLPPGGEECGRPCRRIAAAILEDLLPTVERSAGHTEGNDDGFTKAEAWCPP